MVGISAGIVWLLCFMTAVVLGLVRGRFVTPRLGEARARRLMTLVMCLCIYIYTWIMMHFWGETSVWTALKVGVSWTVATFVFECTMGMVLMKKSWSEIMADYNVCHGRLWLLVLVSTLTAPLACWIITV
ncbi:hypothetical protein [Desulfolutivibrio sp.]|uniref:hypothetical protein n=1 Tax=Desulfolutivibrio sp. TaxID=2773296 RepID=UPI002F961B9C